jgi:hypothetical protein
MGYEDSRRATLARFRQLGQARSALALTRALTKRCAYHDQSIQDFHPAERPVCELDYLCSDKMRH